MTSRFALILLGSAALVGAIIFLAVRQNQSGLLTLEGQLTSVRIAEMHDGTALAVADFEVKNPSDNDFEVRATELALVLPEGISTANLLSKREAADYIQYAKLATPNPQIGAGNQIKAGETVKGMLVGRFETNPSTLAGKTFRIQFTSVNGRVEQFIGKSQ
jgi:hypothetical protein